MNYRESTSTYRSTHFASIREILLMIRRITFMAATITASVVATACSDMTGPTEIQSPGPAGRVSFAAGSRPCVAPGGGFSGALNMLHDETMATIPMTRNAPQGNLGMARAVDVSGC